MSQQGLVNHFTYNPSISPDCPCGACAETTAAKAAFSHQAIRISPENALGLMGDIRGKVNSAPIKGSNKYCFFVVDDCSRYKMEYYLKSTQNMHVHVKAAIPEARKQGYTARFFRLDNESKSDELTALQSELNFTIEYSAAYCQSQNGVSERNIRSWFKIIRAILRDQKKRPRSYWEFAGRCATFIQNRTYTSACPDAAPAGKWYNQPVSARHWRVPLCDIWFYRDKDERQRNMRRQQRKGNDNLSASLEDQRTKGVLVGYSEDSECYLCYCAERNKNFPRRFAGCIVKEQSKLTDGDLAYYDADAENVPANMLESFEKDFAEMVTIPKN